MLVAETTVAMFSAASKRTSTTSELLGYTAIWRLVCDTGVPAGASDPRCRYR